MGGSHRVVIIGGGISGLATAFELNRMAPGLDVRLFEATDRLGGLIRTQREGALTWEAGADSLLVRKAAAYELCQRLGLKHQLFGFDPNQNRVHIAAENKLHQLPNGFFLMAPTERDSVLRSDLFSDSAKAFMLRESERPAQPSSSGDESLSAFVTRRFGSEVLKKVAEPIIGGLFLADASKLSMAMTMPRFLEMERRHGSVLKGLERLVAARDDRPDGPLKGSFFAVKGGMSRLVEQLAAALPPATIHTGRPVDSATKRGATWTIRFSNGGDVQCETLIIACPAHRAVGILRDHAPLAAQLRCLEYASCATVHLSIQRGAIEIPASSHGFFATRSESTPILAGNYMHVKFPEFCPPSNVLLRMFLGGAHHPRICERGDADLIAHCTSWIRTHFRCAKAIQPDAARVFRFPNAMPQYPVHYARSRDALTRSARELGGLHLSGGIAGAIGIPDCVRLARELAESISRRASLPMSG